MPKLIAALLLATMLTTMLTGCAEPDPVINRMNVSNAKYESDLADCKKKTDLFTLSNPVATCMSGKGYQVLMGKSRL